ncbi:MAG: T9SS type A sorting domain-containing protein [Paludibacteraceae bacterium]
MRTKHLLTRLSTFVLIVWTSIGLHAATGSLTIGGTSVADITADASGTGWAWTAATNRLALTSAYTGEAVSIDCVYSDTIKLNYNGNVSITSAVTDALSCNGSLVINGSGGKLNCAYTGSDYYAGIYVGRKLAVYSGDINATISGLSQTTTSDDGKTSVSIYAAAIVTGYYEIGGSANVSAIGNGSHTFGLYCWSYMNVPSISTTGTVTCSATGVGYPIYVPNQMSLLISGGTINLSNADNPGNMIYMNKYYSRFTMTGGVLTYNGGTPPTLTSSSPLSGTYNSTITLSGTHLSGVKNVCVNGKNTSSFTVNGNNSISFIMPSGEAGTASIMIETTGGAISLKDAFTFTSTSYRVFLLTGNDLVNINLGFIDTEANTPIAQPADPQKFERYGYSYVFDGGWYKDSNCTQPWDFANNTITKDYTFLYAKYIQDNSSSVENAVLSSLSVVSEGDGFSVRGIGSEAQLKLYDLNGRLLLSRTVANGEHVSMATCAKGIYVLHLTINGQTVVKKFIY